MKKLLLFFFTLLIFDALSAEQSQDKKKTVCLNMIVKNETAVIRRCLDSVSPIIDYWVIVDTGSEDGTQKMIVEHMKAKNIPGELHERPWRNFGHNRNEALDLAKGKADYMLFIDADEVLAYEDNFKLPTLEKDFYFIMTHFSGTVYARVQIIKDTLNWKWKGVLHEAVDSPQAKTNDILVGVFNDVHTDGARSLDPNKYKKDIGVLEAGILDEPNNTRYVFYLAQSYKDAGEFENSLKNYQKRIAMGGWNEEIFWSMLQTGLLEESLKKPPETIVASLKKSFLYRPTRMEPLYYLANYYRRTQNYSSGYLIANMASKIPMPTSDLLFVQKWIYDYGNLLELSICAYWTEKYEECAQLCHKMLAISDLPQNVRECVQRNLAAANSKLIEIIIPETEAA